MFDADTCPVSKESVSQPTLRDKVYLIWAGVGVFAAAIHTILGLRARGFDNSAVGGELNLLLEILNRLGRGVVIPVAAAGNNKLLPDVGAEETEVLQVDAAVWKDELGDQRRNTRVETNISAGDAAKVEAEVTETRVELIQNKDLALNVAELSQDEPMSRKPRYR